MESDTDASLVSSEQLTIEIAKEVLTSFVRECRICLPDCRRLPGVNLECRLRHDCAVRDLRSAVRLEQSLMVGLDIALCAYAHTHPDVQYYVALYTFLLTLIDNHSVPTQALESYATRGDTCGQPILVWLAECLSTTHEHFVPFAAGTIIAATISFINGEVLDATFRAAPKTRWPQSFVEYKRLRTGAPEAYALFVFDKYNFPDIGTYIHVLPNAMLYINYANDIASFYKEDLASESGTYAQERALASEKSIHAVLREIVSEVAIAVQNMESMLDGASERAAWKSFLDGYLYFHARCGRYRLIEHSEQEVEFPARQSSGRAPAGRASRKFCML